MQTQTNNVPMNISIQQLTLNDETVNAVNARELHAELGVGKVFAAWIKEQIVRAMLVDGVDYEVISESGKNPTGGRPTIDYLISLDASKNLCMMSQCPKGVAIRKYFIEVEKQYRQQPTAEDPQLLMAKALIHAQSVMENQKYLIDEMKPKAIGYDSFIESDGLYTLKQAADHLNDKDLGEKNLAKWLRYIGMLCTKASYWNQPIKKYIDQGIFRVRSVPYYNHHTGYTSYTYQPLITPKGLDHIKSLRSL